METVTNRTNIFLQIAGYKDGHIDEYQIIEDTILGTEFKTIFSFTKKEHNQNHFNDVVYELTLSDTEYIEENELMIKDRLSTQGILYKGRTRRRLSTNELSQVYDIMKKIFDSVTGKIIHYYIDTGIYIVDKNNNVEKMIAGVNTVSNKVTVKFEPVPHRLIRDFNVQGSFIINHYFMSVIGNKDYLLIPIIKNQLFTKLKFNTNLNDLNAIINSIREKFN